MKLDKDDFQKLADTISAAVRDHCGEIARQEAQNMTYRILEREDGSLRDQVRAVIRQQVKEQVGKHLEVQVYWK